MKEETTLQSEIKRLETALESLLALSRKAAELKEENRKQCEAHKLSLSAIKKDYDAVLSMAEDLMKSVEVKPESMSGVKNPNAEDEIMIQAKNDNVPKEDLNERILIEF